MTKGRKVPEQTTDHAAQLRDRLGAAAAAAFNPGVKWETYAEVQREQYRNVGQAVMHAFVRRGTERGSLSVQSAYGAQTQRPYVELWVDMSPMQLSPAKAREVALMLLEAADAAESDELLMRFAQESIGLDERGAVGLLAQFRELREKRRGGKVDAA